MLSQIYHKKNAQRWKRNGLTTISDFLCLKLILEHLKKTINNSNQKVLLDAGCGEGFFTRLVSKNFQRVIGVDFSPEMIKLAQEQSTNGEYRVSDLRQMNFLHDKEIDVVVSISALHYLKDKWELKEAFQEFFRVLTKNGWLFFSVVHPCFNSVPGKPPQDYFDAKFYTGDIFGLDGRRLKIGCYQHQVSDYLNLLVEAGFKIKTVIEPAVSPKLLALYPKIFQRNEKNPQFLIFIAGKS